jgi:hypothetical protein
MGGGIEVVERVVPSGRVGAGGLLIGVSRSNGSTDAGNRSCDCFRGTGTVGSRAHTREPSQLRRGLASKHQTRPDQEGVPGGTLRIVALDGFVVGAGPRKCGFLSGRYPNGSGTRTCERRRPVRSRR